MYSYVEHAHAALPCAHVPMHCTMLMEMCASHRSRHGRCHTASHGIGYGSTRTAQWFRMTKLKPLTPRPMRTVRYTSVCSGASAPALPLHKGEANAPAPSDQYRIHKARQEDIRPQRRQPFSLLQMRLQASLRGRSRTARRRGSCRSGIPAAAMTRIPTGSGRLTGRIRMRICRRQRRSWQRQRS